MDLKDKGTVLKNLNIKTAIIPEVILFDVKDYKKNKKFYLNLIRKKFRNVAVRSSNFSEDTRRKSAAGKFKSFLNIKTKDYHDLENKISKVIDSYRYHSHDKNKILIQKMVENIYLSGVATSCDKNDNSPYYVINLSKSKDSSVITSGREKNNHTYYVYPNSTYKIPKKIEKIKKLIDELKKKFKEKFLDIEFAVDRNQKIYLLQVRKLITKKGKTFYSMDSNFSDHLNKLFKKISKIRNRNYSLLGNTTCFGVMPDWNPAEIVGRRPSPLAFSLYQELITDNVWALQRKNYGYRDLENNSLLKSFFGMPYVDLRIDFNSWIPSDLDNKIAEKLTNFYIKKLKNKPHLHDKIEFEIAFTCFSFSLKKRLKDLPNSKFSSKEKKKIFNSLKKINETAFINLKKDFNKIQLLKDKIKKVSQSKTYYLDKIHWLIEDCKKFGTLPFAGLARCAFIGTELLNSLVNEKIITFDEKEKFLKNIKTITSDLNRDLTTKKKSQFIKKYGHLRPNTYDIDAFNYKDGYETYFDIVKKNKQVSRQKKFDFSKKTLKKIEINLNRNNYNISSKKLIEFITESIRLREYSKFVFTKSIDEIFKNLKLLFERLKISKKELKYISISTIKKLYHSLNHNDLKKIFFDEIKRSKLQSLKNKFIKLPANIFHEKDIYFFKLEKNEPNFISNKIVTSEIYNLKNFLKSKNYFNKIICIENADPGYDFLFSHKIKGLITKYGGVNSHMAIRCNELGVPAAIGVGEKIFSNLINSNKVQLNCQNKTLKKL